LRMWEVAQRFPHGIYSRPIASKDTRAGSLSAKSEPSIPTLYRFRTKPVAASGRNFGMAELIDWQRLRMTCVEYQGYKTYRDGLQSPEDHSATRSATRTSTIRACGNCWAWTWGHRRTSFIAITYMARILIFARYPGSVIRGRSFSTCEMPGC